MDIKIELPGVKLAVVEADDVQVRTDNLELSKLLDEVCARKQKEFTVETLAEAEPVRAARALFRGWGMDPSKYRPASEALLRRVVQGKGLYRVSNVVDVCNLTSLETGWPLGCYDRSRIAEPIVLRHGKPGESYEGIGKKSWDLEGRPVLADRRCPECRSRHKHSANDGRLCRRNGCKAADGSDDRVDWRVANQIRSQSSAIRVRNRHTSWASSHTSQVH
jgi:DNA/RNA-binding domain of Phe-tRNA-synthetase-like protein